MDEQIFRPKQVHRQVFPVTPDVSEAVRAGQKFIVVSQNYTGGIPEGFECFEFEYDGTFFKAFMPTATVRMWNRPGEGDVKEGMEHLADCYEDLGDFVTKMAMEGLTSPQETIIAARNRDIYVTFTSTYLTTAYGEGENAVIQWNSTHLDEFCLNDKGLEGMLKEAAAAQLGMKTGELQVAQDLKQYARHVTKVEYDDTIADLTQIECECGSHVEIKLQYRQRKVKRSIDATQDPPQVSDLIKQINDYQRTHAKNWTEWHERMAPAITRQYLNLKFIYPTNPEKELDITPPKRLGDGDAKQNT